MKKKKGFILVELLAVIVVVLIVVTIVIPLILGIVETARMGAFRDTAYGIAKSGEYLLINERERQTFYYLDYKQYNADNKKLDYRGQSPKTGAVLTEADSKQVALAIHSGTYCATKAADEAKVYVTKTTPEECSSYYLIETKEDTWPEIAEEYDVDPDYLLDLNDETDPTSDPSKKPVKIPIFAISSRRIVSDENKIYYKTFYSVGYTGYLEQFSKTSYEYTIHLGNLPLPLKDIETVRVTEHYTFEKLEEFKTYIVRRNMGDVIWPGEAPKQIDLSKANVFYKHTATSKNMDVDDVVVECDETLCKASIAITVNNLNGVNPNNFEEQLIAYLPVKFTVEFNGESDSCIARTSLDKEAGVLAGTGATDNPYLIESVEDLVALSNNVNNGNTYSGKNISLAITLDLNNSKSYVDATTKKYGDINGNGIIEELKTELTTVEGFKPIGNEIKKFSGKLTGNLNCINNLYIKRPDTNYVGLIGYNNSGTVTMLGINSVNITGLNYTGGIVGHNNGHLNEINISGSVTGNNYVGLIAGYLDYATTARSIIIEGNVLGNDYVGGLVGYNYYSTDFRAVNMGGTVVGTGTNVGRNIGRNYLSDYFSTLALSSVTVNGNIINSPTPNNIHGATFNKIDDLNNLYLAELALDTYIGGDNDGNGYYWDINNSGKLVRKNTATDPLLFTLNGSGTAEDPYIISNYEDLKQVSLKLSSHYKLINDIDMTDNLHYMIGSFVNHFKGNINGNFKTIKNITINSPYASYLGFSGYNKDGRIRDLNIKNIIVNGSNYTGGIAGLHSGHFTEINVTGNITGNNYVGLMTGYADYGSTGRSIIVEGNVVGNDLVGGIVGYNYYSTNLRAINMGGTVVGTGTNVGRNMGRNYLSEYFSTLASASITVNGKTVVSSTPNNIHGVSFNNIDDLNNLYLAEYVFDTYIGGDNDGDGYYWDINNYGKLVQKNTTTDPLIFTLSGSGTAADPYLIGSYEELKQASLKLSAHYKLVNDIDMTNKLHYMIGSFANHFKGNFDGNFKTIKNLSISSPYTSYLGFVGYNEAGRIKNLNLENISVTGLNYTGGTAGFNDGHLNEINITGNVIGNNYVGLMTGYADYGSTGISIIVEGNVLGNDYVGGIVGYNYYSTNLRALNKGGTVVGTGTNVGRNMGRNYLSDYFSTIALASVTVNGNTINSTTPNNIHGITINNIKDLNNLYLAEFAFDTYIGGDNDGNGYYWDIDDLGILVRKSTATDPLIFTLSGSGTTTDPYLISSYDDLKQASLKLSAHYKLVNDIDMTNKLYYILGSMANHFKGSFSGDSKTISNLSINSPYSSYLGFVGYNKDGRIKGINLEKVNIIGSNYIGGVIGFNNGHLNDININGKVIGNNYVGLLTGYTDYGTTLRSIIVEGNISGNDYVGGLIGYNYYSTNLKAINKGGSIVGVGSNIGRNMGRNYIPNYINTGALSTITLNGNLIVSTLVDNKHGLDITLSDLEAISTYTDRGFNFTDETQEYIWYLDNGVAKFRKGNS